MPKFGAIEAGGTTFVCGVGNRPDDLDTVTIPTTTPARTVGAAIDFLRERGGPDLKSVGIAAFGPVDLRQNSPTYGFITSTPKPGWQDVDLAGSVGRALGVSIGFDTDVNAAALGEREWGQGANLSSFLYVSVGTGLGGGYLSNGEPVHGLIHPEMGHIRVPRHPRDRFAGDCPFHGDCLEGLASGSALRARWQLRTDDLSDSHPAWDLEAYYLAQGLSTWVCTLSPQRIAIGGGVLKRSQLYALVRLKLLGLLNGYVRADEILAGIESYVVPPWLGDCSGVLGGLVLAKRALNGNKTRRP